MELRHLRYFRAVAQAKSFTRAATLLRIAQPALSRTVRDLEETIGERLLERSPRGITLTAAGIFFAEQTDELLRRVNEAVEQTRALARGHFGELHVGYAATPTVEILTPALAAFQKAHPRVNVTLHDLSQRETVEALLAGTLQLAVMPYLRNAHHPGIEFETLREYPLCVACAPDHRFARLKTVKIEDLADEPLAGFKRSEYPDYYPYLESVFRRSGTKPRIAVECDGASSLITAIETGRGVAITLANLKYASGRRLAFRPLAGDRHAIPVGIALRKGGDISPAGAKFCEILRRIKKPAEAPGTKKPTASRRK